MKAPIENRNHAAAAAARTDPNRIARLPEVSTLTGLSRTTIYDRVAAREFPPPLKLSAKAIGWRVADVHEWLAARRAGGAA